jgi:hypothetical protein
MAHQHRPGTDLMSKQILLNPTIINMVVETVLGPDAKNQYTPWPNRSISDVLYLPNSQNDGNFPPVLIEVQHTIDNDFVLRLMTYAISVYRQYNQKPPILITFAISSMKYEVSKKTTRNKRLPFLLQYPCKPWARACYFVNDGSLQSSLVLPLPPFVALSSFFIGQHPSLLVNPYHADLTIQLLYSIATRVFQEQINESEKPVEDLMLVCQKTETTITQAIATLSEEVPDLTKWSRTRKILEDGKLVPETFKRKYETIRESSPFDESSSLNETSSLAAPTASNINTNTNTSSTNTNTNTSSTNTNTNTNTNRNWAYLEQSLSNLDEEVSIPWERIYDDGRALGLFENYAKWNTMKSGFYRWKKKQN